MPTVFALGDPLTWDVVVSEAAWTAVEPLEAFVTLDELLGFAPFLGSLVRAHEENDAHLSARSQRA